MGKLCRQLLAKFLFYEPNASPIETLCQCQALHFQIAEGFTQESDPDVLHCVFKFVKRLKVIETCCVCYFRLQNWLIQQTNSPAALRIMNNLQTKLKEQQLGDFSSDFDQLYYSFLGDYCPVTFVETSDHKTSLPQLR